MSCGITLKLYASLGEYLPPGAEGNVAPVDVEEGTTPATSSGSFGCRSAPCISCW